MEISDTKLPGVKLVKPDTYPDHRGLNMELYNVREYEKAGIPLRFVQDNISVSSKNVLRGIHGDEITWKLVTCLEGECFFVVVDCDPASPRFGQSESFMLSEANRWQVLVPPKFGNGHLALSPRVIFHYKWSEYYSPNQFTYRYDDPRFEIAWPVANPILSARDAGAEGPAH